MSGGQEISGKENFKNWIGQFLEKVNDLHLDAIETFQNEDGTRVTSRWVLTGTNNGMLGTKPDQQPIWMTGTAVWAVREDGKLLRNWVEQASFDLYQRRLAWVLTPILVCGNRTSSQPERPAAYVPRSTASKTCRECSNGSDVTPSWLPKGWSRQKTMYSSNPSRTATALASKI